MMSPQKRVSRHQQKIVLFRFDMRKFLSCPPFRRISRAMQSGFWRKCRVCIRWLRRAALVAVLAAICTVLWFNRVGLPDFLKRRLVDSLRARGVELQFDRMRLSLVNGLVAENVRVGHAAGPDSPALSAREVRLELDYPAMLHRRLQLNGLVLREAGFILPLFPTNTLALDHIQTDLNFLANDLWSLDNFQAGFMGAQLKLTGDIAHAPEIRNWDIFRAPRTNNPAASREQLRKFSDLLSEIHFTGTPQLTLAVHGDARDIHSFTIQLAVVAPDARTPWAGARDIQVRAALTAPANAPTNFDSSWSWWTNLQPYRLTWTARLAQLKSKQLNADSIACGGVWSAPELAVTNLAAQLGGGTLDGRAKLNVATREFTFTNASRFDVHAVAALLTEKTRARLNDFVWKQPPSLRAGGSLVLPAWTNQQPDLQTEVQPTIRLAGELAFTNGSMNGMALDLVRTHFSYSNLVWQLPDLALAQSQTRLDISGTENDATREYRWHVRGALDPESLRPFLTDSNAARGLDRFTFTGPAHLDTVVSGRLFDYDSIGAGGCAALTNFTVSGHPVDSAAGGLLYTNHMLVVSNLALAQSENRLDISGWENDATKEYRFDVRGGIAPASLRPFLTDSNAVRGLDHLAFTEPVHFDIEVAGNFSSFDTFGASGHVAATNFAVRGQSADSVVSVFSYTNREFVFTNPHLWRGTQTMTADTVTLDLNARLIRFHNGYSTADPGAVTRAIGPKTAEIMEPYHFLEPPTTYVEGCVPLRDINGPRDMEDTDLRFNVVGGVPFQCLKLNATRITGTVRWLGGTLILTNVAAELYGGGGNGSAVFDFRVPHAGADYQFTATVTNVNLHALAAEFSSPTNRLEGLLSGHLVVTRADTRDWQTPDGHGHAQLRDGVLWDIPVFGILSPVLNAVSPGLGNSRATDAAADFVITNGEIYSDLLKINTGMTRLQYTGTVDLKQNVNARVTAQLLQNVWGVGPVIGLFTSPFTKIFEYKITGTLKNPRSEPVYVPGFIPKLLELPLHPIRGLEGLLPGGGNLISSPTNAPDGKLESIDKLSSG